MPGYTNFPLPLAPIVRRHVTLCTGHALCRLFGNCRCGETLHTSIKVAIFEPPAFHWLYALTRPRAVG